MIWVVAVSALVGGSFAFLVVEKAVSLVAEKAALGEVVHGPYLALTILGERALASWALGVAFPRGEVAFDQTAYRMGHHVDVDTGPSSCAQRKGQSVEV